MSQVEIRSAAPKDAACIAAVHVHSFVTTYSHLPRTRRSAEDGLQARVALWYRRLGHPEPGCSTLVATVGGQIRGFVYMGPSGDVDDRNGSGQVLSIHVSPQHTGQGVGTRLMQEAIASLAADGYTTATLWVVSENHAARRFYERLGWHVDGTTRRVVLAVENEGGDEVEVIRYRLAIDVDGGDSR